MSNLWPRTIRPCLDRFVSTCTSNFCVVYIRRREKSVWTGSSFVRKLLKDKGLYSTKYCLMNADFEWEGIANDRFFTPLNFCPDMSILSKTEKIFCQMFSIVPGEHEILTPTDAVKLLPRFTHPGFPFETKHWTKEEALKAHLGFILGTLDLQWRGDVVIRTARKVEMRSLEKFESKTVRTISMCDLSFVANGIRLFTPLMTSLKDSSFETPYWCGRGRFGGTPHMLRCKLYDWCQVLDVKAMDSSGHPVIYEVLYRWKCSRMKPMLHLAEKIMWYMTQNLTSLLVDSMGRVFARDHGNSTGQYCTTSDNTLDMIFCLIYCLLWNGRNPFDFIWKCVGDDTWFTARTPVELEGIDWIKPFAELGKTIKVGPIVKTEDAEFLGDKLVFQPSVGMWMPVPYNLEKMYAAWAEHCRKESPLMNYIRTFHFYVQCFWDPVFQKVTLEALDLLRPDPSDMLNMNRVRWSDEIVFKDQVVRGDVVSSLVTTPIEIVRLYTGWQGYYSQNSGETSCFELFRTLFPAMGTGEDLEMMSGTPQSPLMN